MKKLFPKIIIIILVLTLGLTLAACDNSNGGNSNSGNEQLPSATYTVTFDSNGGTDFSAYNTTVTYGGKISKPTAEPTKKGYTFKWWSKSGSTDEFFFTQTITSNTTLKAQYTARTYEHETVMYEDKYSTVLDTTNYNFKVYADNYTTYPSGFPVKSEFDALKSLPIAISVQKGGTGSTFNLDDYFVYWYTLDENNKEVRYSTWASRPIDSTSTFEVKELKKYSDNIPKILYAKWHSCLPSVAITFNNVEASYTPVHNTKYNDNLKNLTAPTKTGYEFSGWQYTRTNEDGTTSLVDLNTELALTDEILVKNTGDDNYNITLTAKWKRDIHINTVTDYSTKLYSPVINLYSQIAATTDNATLQTLNAQLDEYLKANITIYGDLDFGYSKFKPLFSKDYPFKGTINGTKDTETNTRYKISNVTIEDYDSLSFFGYVSGKISNLDFANVKFSFTQKDGAYAKTAYVAPVVTALLSGGIIENCNVVYNSDLSLSFNNEIVFGGIAASTFATKIFNGTFNYNNITIKADTASIGGIVGICQYSYGTSESGNIDKCSVQGNEIKVIATKNANVGGVAAMLLSGGSVTRTSFTGTLKVDAYSANVGGIAASAIGEITNSYSKAIIAVDKVKGTAYVGGIVGKMDYIESNIAVRIYRCYAAEGTINVNVSDKGKAYVAGIIGYAYKGKIEYSFSLINFIDVKSYNASGTLNSLEDAAKLVKIGFLYAKSELANNTSTINKVFYEPNVIIKLNNNQYSYTVEGTTGTENFAIDRTGDYKAVSEIKVATFYKSTLGFTDAIWIMLDGSLPTLK